MILAEKGGPGRRRQGEGGRCLPEQRSRSESARGSAFAGKRGGGEKDPTSPPLTLCQKLFPPRQEKEKKRRQRQEKTLSKKKKRKGNDPADAKDRDADARESKKRKEVSRISGSHEKGREKKESLPWTCESLGKEEES